MNQKHFPLPIIVLARFTVASVWLYQGLWLKWIGPWEEHLQIVTTSTGFSVESSAIFLRLIGLFEIALAVWVLTGRGRLAAAGTQTLILVSMNTVALFTANHLIDRPFQMVVQNLVLLALVWLLASAGVKNHESSQSSFQCAAGEGKDATEVGRYAMGGRKAGLP